MSFIKQIVDSLYSESALARRERRLIDRLIVDETALNDAQKKLERICSASSLDVRTIQQLDTKINGLVVKITDELKDLLAKESVELQKEITTPQENLSHVLIAVEQYLKYLISEKTISAQTGKEFRRLLDEINKEFLGLEAVLEKVISQSQTLFTSIYQQRGTSGFEQVDFNKFLAAGDVFEKNKIALSRTIKSLYRKLHNLEKELRKEINRYHRERKKTVKYTIAELCKRQRNAIVAAHALLVTRGVAKPLGERDQEKIRERILEALQLETQIIQEMNSLGIPAKLDLAVREQTGLAKKQFQTLVNKLKYYKTNSGVYPFEFWLGEKRALGFLKINDPKNLGWLKELLEEGLLHEQYGMLSERDSGIQTLIAQGFLNTAHDEFLLYLEDYQKGFLELATSIEKRAEISSQVFSILASAMFHTEKVIEQTRNVTDAAVKKAQEQAKGREAKLSVIVNWEKIRAQEAAAVKLEREKIRQEAGETMATLGVTRTMERRSRAQGLSFMQKALISLALVSQLISSSTSPAMMQSPTQTPIILQQKGDDLSKAAMNGELSPQFHISPSLFEKVGSFLKAKKDVLMMITEGKAYSTESEYNNAIKQERKVIEPFLEEVKKKGLKIEYYPGEELMLVYTKDGKLITDFQVRGGPEKRYVDPKYTDHFYGPTPAGTFEVSKSKIKPYVKRNSAWYMARIKWGAKIRLADDGEIQVSENEGKSWFYATGKKAKIRSFDKEDFYRDGVLLSNWYFNPFGHLTIELKNKKGSIMAEKIHTTPPLERGEQMGETRISHGCMHIAPTDIDELARLLLISPDQNTVMKIHSYSTESGHNSSYVKSTPRKGNSS